MYEQDGHGKRFGIGNVPSIGGVPEGDSGSAGAEHGHTDLEEVIALLILLATGGHRNPGIGGNDKVEQIGGIKRQLSSAKGQRRGCHALEAGGSEPEPDPSASRNAEK